MYLAMQGLGLGLCAVALVWGWLRRHERRIWRQVGHSAKSVVAVLELEQSVLEVERLSAAVDPR
jgi:hypothetical protein